MKRISRIVPVIISCLVALQFSCKKTFLNTPPSNQATVEAYVTNLSGCNEYLKGIYVDITQNLYSNYNLIYPELIADNLKPATGSSAFSIQYNWAQTATQDLKVSSSSTDVNMNGLWTIGYKIIRSSSWLIENIDRFRNENSVTADTIKGQAFAIRAMVHHFLVNVFAQPYGATSGGTHVAIPYVSVSDYTQPVSRQNVNEVYDKIILDFKNAIALLTSTTSKYYINKNAAKALLARVYLFRNDFSNAKNLAAEVSAANPVLTINYPQALFTYQDNESLYQLPPYSVGYTTVYPSVYFKLIKQFIATTDIATTLTENTADKRRVWVTLSGSDYNITKYPNSIVAGYTYPEGAYFQPVVRSSEMVLTAAEAYAKVNNEDSARYYLNIIRTRAGIPALTNTITGTALVDSVYKERRRELCFEGLRMFDLLRTGKGVSRADAPNPAAINLLYLGFKTVAPIHLADVNYYGIPQNQGY